MAKTIEHEGETYILKDDSDKIISNFKSDMEKYKTARNELKKEVEMLQNNISDKEIEVQTFQEKIAGYSEKETETNTIKSDLAEARGEIKRLVKDLDLSKNTLTEREKSFKSLVIENKLRSAIAKRIHPDYIDDAVALASSKANIDNDGNITMGSENLAVDDYVTTYANSRKHIALDPNAKTGAGIKTTSHGTQGKALREMTQKEKREFATANPQAYNELVQSTILK